MEIEERRKKGSRGSQARKEGRKERRKSSTEGRK